MKKIVRVLLIPFDIFCLIIQWASSLAVFTCGWIFRLMGLLLIVGGLYCRAVNWTEDQMYLASIFIIGCVTFLLPTIVTVLSVLAETLRKAVHIWLK